MRTVVYWLTEELREIPCEIERDNKGFSQGRSHSITLDNLYTRSYAKFNQLLFLLFFILIGIFSDVMIEIKNVGFILDYLSNFYLEGKVYIYIYSTFLYWFLVIILLFYFEKSKTYVLKVGFSYITIIYTFTCILDLYIFTDKYGLKNFSKWDGMYCGLYTISLKTNLLVFLYKTPILGLFFKFDSNNILNIF